MSSVIQAKCIKITHFFEVPFEKSKTADYDADIFCLALKDDGRIEANEDMVFYNNYFNENKSITLYGDCISCCPNCGSDSVSIDLARINQQYQTILVLSHLYQAYQRGESFDDGHNEVRIQELPTPHECVGEDLINHVYPSIRGSADTLELCRLVRRDNDWEIIFPDLPEIKMGFEDYLISHGVILN